MPKPSGVTYNRYAAIASRVLRSALKDSAKSGATVQDQFDLRMLKWESGKIVDGRVLDVPLKK